MIRNIDHIGIAVKDLKKTIKVLECLGLSVAESGRVEAVQIEVAFFDVGGTRIELVSPLVEEHELAQHIKERGEGLHHIAFNVKDIGETAKNLEKSGIRIDPARPSEAILLLPVCVGAARAKGTAERNSCSWIQAIRAGFWLNCIRKSNKHGPD